MRIIAGKYRHRIIEMTNLETTRETQDSVREAIFNMIGPYFDGGVCLDLFAGSGAMGIEAISRGMEKLYLNDLNKDAIKVCKLNCNKLGIEANYYNLDYELFLKQNNQLFDLIILDPPYKMNDVKAILDSVKPHLNKNGIIVFEMAKETNYQYDALRIIKDKTYGIKRVVVYKE